MENNKNKVNRGEIYYYDFGFNECSMQNGFRPVLVIQCNEGNETSPTTVVAAITASLNKCYLPSHIFLGEQFGLTKPSMAMLEQLKTVNQSELKEYIGTVDDPLICRLIDNGLKKSLGLWVHRSRSSDDIRCLCSKCLNDYRLNPDYIVKRLDPYVQYKQRCDKCTGLGYDYIVIEKSTSVFSGGRQNDRR